MKKIIVSLCLFACVLACAFGLVACGGKDSDGNGNNANVGGTYYYCEDGVADDTIYIVFAKGKWSDDEGQTGDYTVSGNIITLYITGGEKIEFASGSVSGDDITLNIMGENVVYRKGEDIAAKPIAKTLAYVLSEDRTYYTVKGIGGLTGDIEIPDEWKKKPVKEISENAFADCKDLISITVGNNVETIGKKAFYKCAELVGVTLGESVNKISEGMFEECRKLESVTIPKAVIAIEKNAFTFCLALKDVYFTGTASDWAQIDFYYDMQSRDVQVCNPLCDNNIYIVGNNTAEAEHRSRNFYLNDEFASAIEITEATFIEPIAFKGYKGLKSLTIGGSVNEIGEYAFSDCSGLETLRFSDENLKTIGRYAFNRCEKLFAAYLSDSVTKIGEYAFNECENLTGVKTGDGVMLIGEGAFMGCTAMNALTLGFSVAEISESAFYGCESLASVNIPSTAVFIGKDAFFGTGLTSATFINTQGWRIKKGNNYESVENLDDPTYAATLLKESILMNGYSDHDWEKQTLIFTLSNDRTYYTVRNNGTACRAQIEIPAFYNGKPVKNIESNAFENCSGLINITIPDSVTQIDYTAFTGCSSLMNITVDENNDYYSSKDGILYNKDLTKIIYIPSAKTELTINGITEIFDGMFGGGGENIKKIVLGDNVTSIGEYAFIGFDNLESVTISNSVTRIGNSAFAYSGITDITIPNSVTSIGDYAFSMCRRLTSITIPDSVTSIGERAFTACYVIYCEVAQKLDNWPDNWNENVEGSGSISVVWDCKNNDKSEDDYVYVVVDGIRYALKDNVASVVKQDPYISGNIILPDKIIYSSKEYQVTRINRYAFNDCLGLTSVTIPIDIKDIGYLSFDNCYALTIYCEAKEKPDTWDGLWNGYDYQSPVVWDCRNNDKDKDGYVYTVIDGIRYSLKDAQATVIQQSCNIFNAVIPPIITYDNVKYTVSRIINGAFGECTNLTSITIPFIGTDKNNPGYFKSIFKYDDYPESLKTIILTDILSIGTGAFDGCGMISHLTIPKSLKKIEPFAFCDNVASISYTGDIVSWCSIVGLGNLPFQKQYINGKAVAGTLIIPDGVTSIGDYAFAYCSSITKVIISSDVTNIGNGAFSHCTSLKSITIPNSITSIGDYAFAYCSSITSITIPDGVESIGRGNAFWECVKLVIYCEMASAPDSWDNRWNAVLDGGMGYCPVVWDCKNNDSDYLLYENIWYFLEDGVACVKQVGRLYSGNGFVIYDKVIYKNREYVVKSIGDKVFYGWSGLKSITFNGTMAQWRAIEKGYDWNYGTGNYTIHCTDGDIGKWQ